MIFQTFKLKDICSSISDGDHQPPPKTNEGIPFITISNIDENNHIDFANVMYVPNEYYDKLADIKKAKKGDVLYSVVGSFGKPVYVSNNEKFVFQRHIAILRPAKNVNSRYLYYMLLNPEFYRKADYYAIGAAQRTLSLDSLRNMEIKLPSLDVQNRVVEILGKIDDKIENNNKINDNLEQQANIYYDYFFNQFDFPDEHQQPYHSSNNLMVYNDALKRTIPKDWSVCCVKDLLTVVTGKEDANFSTENGIYKFFTCSQESLLCDDFSFDGKAVLIAGNGDFNVKHYSGKFNAYQRTYVLIPNDDKFYGIIYLIAKSYISRFRNGSNGSIVKFITKGDVENMHILVPNTDEYYLYLNKLMEMSESLQTENEKLIKLRNWLLPMLMNGQAAIED